jgi:hypothetical protein
VQCMHHHGSLQKTQAFLQTFRCIHTTFGGAVAVISPRYCCKVREEPHAVTSTLQHFACRLGLLNAHLC